MSMAAGEPGSAWEGQTTVTPYQIAGNTLYLIVAQAVARGLGLATAMILTRHLGPAGYGDLTLAYAYWSLFATLVEAGLELTLIREASQHPDRAGRLLGTGILLRGLLGIAGYLLAMAILPGLGYDSAAMHLCRVALLMLFLSPTAISRLFFLITLEIKRLAVLEVLGQLIHTALVLVLILLGISSGGQLILAQFTAMAVAQGLYFAYGRHLLPVPICFKIDWPLWKMLLRRTWPLAIAGALYTVQIQVSRLMVGRTLNSADGGHYTVAVSLAAALGFLPSLYFTSIYPLLSRSFVQDREEFRRLVQYSFGVMMAISLPVALLVTLTGQTIITLYAGAEYLDATPLLVALIWIQVLHFGSTVLYHAILAAGQQRILLWAAVVLTAVRLGAFAFLLPRLGLLAAAYATLAMYVVGLILYGVLDVTRVYVVDWIHRVVRPAAGLCIPAVLAIVVHPPDVALWVGGLAVYALTLSLVCGGWFGDRSWLRKILRNTGWWGRAT
jgi:O-antigen/teichoic acid export membrane protein